MQDKFNNAYYVIFEHPNLINNIKILCINCELVE